MKAHRGGGRPLPKLDGLDRTVGNFSPIAQRRIGAANLIAIAEFFTGPLRRYHRGDARSRIDLCGELGPSCVVPGSYQIDLTARMTRTGERQRRWVVARYRRYDIAQLGAALTGIGWAFRGEVQQKDGGAPLSICLFERT